MKTPYVIRLMADKRRYWTDYLVPHWTFLISDALRYDDVEALPTRIGRAELHEGDEGELVYIEADIIIATVVSYDDEATRYRKRLPTEQSDAG